MQARALNRLAPEQGDMYIATVGTSATAEVDLFSEYGIDTRQVPRSRIYVTVEADGEVFIVFGDTGLNAPVIAATSASPGTPDGRCHRIPADSPRTFVIEKGRHFFRAIATSAATRLEITKG